MFNIPIFRYFSRKSFESDCIFGIIFIMTIEKRRKQILETARKKTKKMVSEYFGEKFMGTVYGVVGNGATPTKALVDRLFKNETGATILSSPVEKKSVGIGALKEAEKICDYHDEDECYPQPEEATEKSLLNEENDIATVKFAEEIKVDFIPTIDFRIMCRFLGASSVNDIKNHPFSAPPLITLILMEALPRYMESNGYSFAGELNFDCHGNSIPPEKNPWIVDGKETAFTIQGFLYFEANSGKREDNVCFFLFADLERGGAAITCYTRDVFKSKTVMSELQEYSKHSNCLRGAKLKDVNMFAASFVEVDNNPSYNWDNYYYPKNIIDLFDLEVFEFVKNSKKYNECGITKRGLIMHGKPGTGKTTIGNIICNMIPDHTVIWITPEILAENMHRAFNSIKSLYKLADFVSPCVIILEDLDLFGNDRDRGGDVLSLGALMNVLDGVNSIKNAVTIGTTNRLSSIESALKNRPGRFDRVIEIPPLPKELRKKMFKDRLKGWIVEKGTLDYVVENTDEWTGAEAQEFINSLNLKHIGSNKKKKKLTMVWAEEIIKTMSKFGVGEASSSFGFGSGN